METRIPLNKLKKNSLSLTLRETLTPYKSLFEKAKKMSRLCRYLKWKAISQFRKFGNSFNFDLIYFVKTDEILLCTEKEFGVFRYDGVRLNSDWDITTKKFNNLDVYIAFTDHFLNNIEWENTQYYKNILRIINKGYAPWHCTNENDLKERCQSFDVLYENIKQSGYKKQTELSFKPYDIRNIDEISVNLDRDGNLLFNNSAHRLSIAKILGIETIPVRITVCHTKCKNFEKLHLTEKEKC